jgi:hypothetical protein
MRTLLPLTEIKAAFRYLSHSRHNFVPREQVR